MKIKVFCDIADLNLIKKFNKKKIVKGFTTNPSLMRKVGAKNYSQYCNNILKITKKPISFEVFSDEFLFKYKYTKPLNIANATNPIKYLLLSSGPLFFESILSFCLLNSSSEIAPSSKSSFHFLISSALDIT